VIGTTQQPAVLSVSELAHAIRISLESGFPSVRVRGEIAKVTEKDKAFYIDFKDSQSVINAVIWKSSRINVPLSEGAEMIFTGRVSAYQSRWQLVVSHVELAGEGALLKMLEERKKRLAAMGLFEAGRKRPLPLLPAVIGVITSPTGAVIHDMLDRLKARCPAHVIVWPVLVQGEQSAAQVIAAIKGFAGFNPRPDVIIIARGGGSIEDLMPFSDEQLVLAAAQSPIPIVSAIGHDTDTPILDFAADWRAPTPTAAAERCVPVRVDLLQGLASGQERLTHAMLRIAGQQRTALDGLSRGLVLRNLVELCQQRLDFTGEKLGSAMKNLSTNAGRALENLSKMLEVCSYKATLQRGFAVVKDRRGTAVPSAAVAGEKRDLTIEFHDGELNVKADS